MGIETGQIETLYEIYLWIVGLTSLFVCIPHFIFSFLSFRVFGCKLKTFLIPPLVVTLSLLSSIYMLTIPVLAIGGFYISLTPLGFTYAMSNFELVGYIIIFTIFLLFRSSGWFTDSKLKCEPSKLFRAKGLGKSKMQEYIKKIDKKEKIDYLAIDDINIISSLFLSYYNDLPNPLIPKNNVNEYLEAFGLKNGKVKTLKVLIEKDITDSYYITFGLLLHLLNFIFVDSDEDKQILDNFGTTFAPAVFKPDNLDSKIFLQTLFKCKEVMKLFIENYESLIDTETILSYLMKYQLDKSTKKVAKKKSAKFNQEISRKVSLDSRLQQGDKKKYSIRNFSKLDRSFDLGITQNSRLDRKSSFGLLDTPRRRSKTLVDWTQETPRRKNSASKSNNSDHSNDSNSSITDNVKFATIWNPSQCFLFKFDTKTFSRFLFDIIVAINEKGIVKQRKYLLKPYDNCFPGPEAIDAVLALCFDKEEEYLAEFEISRELVVLIFEFLFDLNAIECIIDKPIKFNEKAYYYRFSDSVVGSRLTDQDFLDEMSSNFEQFKEIATYVGKPDNIKDTYDLMIHPENGITMKNRVHHLKVYQNVFVGAEFVTWIKKTFFDSKLTKFGAICLGECLRQLGTFDSANGDHIFDDSKNHFFKIAGEEAFLIGLLEYHRNDERKKEHENE
eukprot:gene4994-8592_t